VSPSNSIRRLTGSCMVNGAGMWWKKASRHPSSGEALKKTPATSGSIQCIESVPAHDEVIARTM